MSSGFQYVIRKKKQGNEEASAFLKKECLETVRDFHRTFPEYRVTPLVSL